MDNNNDKAKKILFGNKNLGGDPMWHTEGVSNRDTSKTPPPIPQSQWNDPEMTGDISRFKKFSMYADSLPSVTSDHTITPPIDTSMGIIPEIKNGAEIQYDPKASLKIDEIEMIEPKQPSYDTTSMDIQNPIDNLNRTCVKCLNGAYVETGQLDDLKGVLHCSNCGHEIPRWRYTTLLPEKRMDIQNEKAEGESLQEYCAKYLNKETLDKRYSDMDAASKLISFTIIHNYCHDNNCSPQDLIEAHKDKIEMRILAARSAEWRKNNPPKE